MQINWAQFQKKCKLKKPCNIGLNLQNDNNFCRTTWYIKYPPLELRDHYYLQPFDNYVWFAFLSVVILGTALLLISRKFIQKQNRILIDDLFLPLECLCNQCGNDLSEDAHYRLLSISLRMIALICVTGLYGAVITSFFAYGVFQPPFKNLDEFIANGQYRITIGLPTDARREVSHMCIQ